jgi:hypothetical protein
MPRYQVTLDGKTFVVEGERPPTEDEARQALSAYTPPQAPPEQAKPEGRSLSGFLGNVASSGGRFIKDTVTGLPATAAMLSKGWDMVTNPVGNIDNYKALADAAPRIISAGGQALKNRYGGTEQIKNTLYNDPVGVLSDVSTVMMPAKAGLKAGGFAKLAKAAGAVETATNPMTAIGGMTRAVTKPVARGIVRGTLRPPAAVRDDFGGAKGVADAVLKDRVYSEASAGRRLNRSTAATDALLAERQAAGVQGPRTKDVADAVISGKPAEKAQLRARLGEPDASGALLDTAIDIEQRNPPRLGLTDAQAMKREAQELAYEAGQDNKTVAKAAQKAKAQSLRSGIEQQVPEVGPMNEQSQRLLGSKLAFGAAEDRPRALTNFLSILGGGAGFAGGGPLGAVVIPALMKAADSPRMGAMTGIGINEFGRGMNAESLRKAALIARLMGEDE